MIEISSKIRPVVLCIILLPISISSEALALRPKSSGRSSDVENAIVKAATEYDIKTSATIGVPVSSDRTTRDGKPFEDSSGLVTPERYEAISEILSRLADVTEIIPTSKHLVVVQKGEISLADMALNLPTDYLTVYDLSTRQPVSKSLNRWPVGRMSKFYINDGYLCIRLRGNTMIGRRLLQSPCTFFDLSTGEALEGLENIETPFMRDDAGMMSKTHAAVLNLDMKLTVFELATRRPAPGLIDLDASKGYALYDNYLAVYSSDNRVRVYNPATGRKTATLYAWGFRANEEFVVVQRPENSPSLKEGIVIWKPGEDKLLTCDSSFLERLHDFRLVSHFLVMRPDEWHIDFGREDLFVMPEVPRYVIADIITGKVHDIRCHSCKATKDFLIIENPRDRISVCEPESAEPVNGLVGLDAERGLETTDSHLITIDSQKQLRAFHLYTGEEILKLPDIDYSFSKVFLQGPSHISYLWVPLPNGRVISYLLDADKAVPFYANPPWQPHGEFTAGEKVLSISGERISDGTVRTTEGGPNSRLLSGKTAGYIPRPPGALRQLILKARNLLLKSRKTAIEIDTAA